MVVEVLDKDGEDATAEVLEAAQVDSVKGQDEMAGGHFKMAAVPDGVVDQGLIVLETGKNCFDKLIDCLGLLICI
ncbi:hypothetical protein ACFLX2_01200 [Candidatus Dependentiae bacterium]